MNLHEFDRTARKRYLATPIVAVATGAMILTACSSRAGSTGSGGGPQTTVSISSNYNSGPELMQVALGKRYYQQNGLKTVNIVGYGTQGADQIALLLGGHAQFLNGNSSLLLHSRSSGSDIVALMNVRTGGSIAVVVAQDEAEKLHIPSANSTEADVEAQLDALKGSGLEIGVPSETGDNYSDLLGAAKTVGLNVGGGDDIKISSLGGTANLKAAFGTGKVKAFAQTSPQTYVANTVMIPLYKVPPISTQSFTTLATTRAEIKNHPEVVQEVVNSYLQAMVFDQHDPTDALQYLASSYKQAGADPSQNQQIFNDQVPQLGQPAITQNMFTTAVSLAKNTGKMNNINFSDYVDNSFVNKGIAQLKLKYPTGP